MTTFSSFSPFFTHTVSFLSPTVDEHVGVVTKMPATQDIHFLRKIERRTLLGGLLNHYACAAARRRLEASFDL